MFEALFEFIRRQYPEQEHIPLHVPLLGVLEKQYLNQCIDSTFVSSVGPAVEEFEQALCRVSGCRYAIATVNGTAALQLGLIAAGVTRDDEVITQPLSFIATANAITHCGAYPVFVDINRETLAICPKALRQWLETHTTQGGGVSINKGTGRPIKACVCMHTYGHPALLIELAAVCEEFNIALVEDAAEALGSEYRGEPVGQRGLCAAFSFNGNKVITTGGGGALVTSDEALARKARHLATTAKLPHVWESCHDSAGFNFRMPNLNASLGCAQMQRLADILGIKRRLADNYRQFFADTTLEWIEQPKGCRSNFWLNGVLCRDRQERDQLLQAAYDNHIQLRPAWELLSESRVYRSAESGDLPVATEIADRLVNLPSSAAGFADA